ncbi:carboxypeptidase-like regulatory domain-containing protein [Myxococcus sp. K38C18041901]|uniref:carboxypeptidase-like regulatory domain-containing protein n=1 Tax=Myxococcus guangdongensis TaxID=2906760 RepID=UPI0020A7C664|nr:carboxypeptidase-like regulatory domain-containing protein [Myxococcus guangdongensis]MCP3065678.1 carboxypeptidase-like regulatory domain-containing protein [Myxococcus guangdongensis]
MPRPRTGLSIRGTVVDGLGRPVARARVSASWPEEGETLSTIPCPRNDLPSWATPDVNPTSPWLLADCLPQTEDMLVSLLLARQGEAPVHAQTLSAEDGSFVLEDLPEGLQALLALSEHGAVSRTGVPASSQDVELMLEQPVLIEGQVLGDDDAPLEGVSLTLVSLRHTRFFDARTDARGEFKLGPVPHDIYLLLASKEGWRPVLKQTSSSGLPEEVRMHRSRRLSGQVISGAAPAAGVEVVAVMAEPFNTTPPFRATTDSGGRFELELNTGSFLITAEREGRSALARVTLGASPSPEVLLELGEALQVEGTVLDETSGAAVAGARVSLLPPGQKWTRLETTTDSAGRYRVGPVEPGDWTFGIQAPGYVGRERENRTLAPAPGTQDFTLKRAATITGHVVDEAGQPLGNVELLLMQAALGPGEEEYVACRTAADGSFMLDAASPGRFELIAYSHRVVTKTLVVRAPMTGLRITLSTGGSVEGTLTDARGLPVPGFKVVLAPLKGDEPNETLHTPNTDLRGRFSRAGVAPGRYRVKAEQSSYSVTREAWSLVEVQAGAVTKVDLRLPVEHALEGSIVDTSGNPIQGARILVRAQRDASDDEGSAHIGGCEMEVHPEVVSDAKGHFVVQGLRDADHLVSAFRAGHVLLPEQSTGETLRDEEVLIGAEVKQVRLVMKRRAHVQGRLVGPDGAPPRKFLVNDTWVTSPDGTFSVPNHEGPFHKQFIFQVKGLPKVMRTVEGGWDGPDIDLGEIRMEAGRELRGVVRDARTGDPVSGVRVRIDDEGSDESPDPELQLQALSNREGRFVLGPVRIRPLTLLSTTEDRYPEQRTQVDSSQQEVSVWMSPGARVHVRVMDPEGKPAQGSLLYQSMETSQNKQLSNGAWETQALAPGRYTFRWEGAHPGAYPPQQVDVPAQGDISVVFQPVTTGTQASSP